MSGDPQSILILTCSFRGDLDLCRLLCETVDRQAPGLLHRILVPRRDLHLFSPLATGSREIVAQEDFVPAGIRALPIPGGAWRRWAGLSHRDVFRLRGGGLSNGWILQQVVKISAALAASEDVIVHVDSDAAMIRPLDRSSVIDDGGRVRLFANPAIGEREPHGSWHLAAANLLHLPPTRYFGAGYIDQMVVWRRDRVADLVALLEQHAGRDWRDVLLRTAQFSEYILYGVFCEHVLGPTAGHFVTDKSLALTCWTHDAVGGELLAGLRPYHRCLAIQSTIPIPLEIRRTLVGQATARAERDAISEALPADSLSEAAS